MKPGDSVEVLINWAYSPEEGALKAWTKGYEFVSTDGKQTVVKHTAGLFKGTAVNYSSEDVRAQQC